MESEEVAATKNLGVRKSWRSPLGFFTARAQQFRCWPVLSFYTAGINRVNRVNRVNGPLYVASEEELLLNNITSHIYSLGSSMMLDKL